MLYRIKAPDREVYDALKSAFKETRIEIELPLYLTIAVEDLSPTEKRMITKAGGTFMKDYQYTTG
jgi:hypothetical protein